MRLVEPVRNKGFRVTEVDERDLDQYTDIRLLIEVPTVGRVTLTAGREELRALRPIAEEIVAAARAHDLIGYLDRTADSISPCSACRATRAWWRRSATCASAPGCTV